MKTDRNTCYNCGRYLPEGEAELHHIFFGGLRPISDKLGLVVYLCKECHRGTNGVHGKNGNKLNRKLKKIAQEAWEAEHSHEEWMKIVGRSYL